MKKKGIDFYFKRIDEIMSMAANAHLKKYDITCSQANILFYMLEKGKNVVMQKEIEQEFGLRHSTIIGLLKRMEKNNFVRVEVIQRTIDADRLFCLTRLLSLAEK